MKQWQETSHILRRIAALAERGEQAAVATVVQIKGSAYRRPGAKLLVEESGMTVGGVSGGCLEADVREVGLAVMRDNTPRLRHYDTGSDDTKVWGLGLGCNGSVDIFVQPATSQEALQVSTRVRELLEGDVPFAVSTVVTEKHDEEERGAHLYCSQPGRQIRRGGRQDFFQPVSAASSEVFRYSGRSSPKSV